MYIITILFWLIGAMAIVWFIFDILIPLLTDGDVFWFIGSLFKKKGN